MGEVMNFTSQICTTKEQSERLLALGLTRETADCFLEYVGRDNYGNNVWHPSIIVNNYRMPDYSRDFPAWSLHRLITMLSKEIFHQSKQWHLFLSLCYEDAISYEECNSSQPCYLHFCSSDNIYDNVIESIEWLIGAGHFNKEYLKEK